MPSVCLISLNYAPEPIGIGPYSQGWAEALAARGHDVQVVCGEPHYPDWRRHPDLGGRLSTLHEGGVRVTRLPIYIPGRPSGVTRLAHYASFALALRRQLPRLYPDAGPHAVVAVAPALAAAPIAQRFARRHRALSWLHVQDFELEAAVATGFLPAWLGDRAAGFERWVLRGFDRVSSIAPKMVEKASAKRGSEAGVYEMRNWSEPGVGDAAASGEAMRRRLGLPDGLVALYSGNLARKQGVHVILEAAERLRERTGLHFVICGDGPAAGEVEAAARRLPNVHVRGLQPREDLPDLLAMADIHLLPQIREAADLVLPSKLANMLASGRPVVATADPGTSLAREVEGCGLVCAAGDAAGLAAAVDHLADDAQARRQFGQAARERAQARWARDILLDRFAATLERDLAEKAQ